jgi:CheY-like chemotaxis protein
LEKVLLIDDSDIDNLVNRKVVEKAGLSKSITVKKSAASAFEWLKETAVSEPENIPDIIFLDIRMPETDGFGFLELFEELPAAIHHKTRIVMLSSSIDSEDYKRAMENRFVIYFLNKPLNKEAVFKISEQIKVL